MWYYRQQLKRRYDPGKPYMVFITLTLPSAQVHDDRVINRQCLQPFLVGLKRHHGITHYFWRAEAQENGNVHYHILTDRYIDKRDLQLEWLRAINKLGYEDRYYEQSGKVDAPCTDVHRMTDQIRDKNTGEWRTVDPVEYLLDYVTDVATLEEDDDPMMLGPAKERKLHGRYRTSDGRVIEYTARPVAGRLWGMSDHVRQVREPRAECTAQVWGSLKRAEERGELRMHALDHATLYFGDIHRVIGRARGWMGELINLYYLHVFNWLYPNTAPEQWIKQHGTKDASRLWINTRARQLSEDVIPGTRDHLEYQPATESPLITDLRRQLVGPKCNPRLAEIMVGRAIKFYFD